MRRLSLTATLAGVFTLITLATFYFVGSYLFDNLSTQLIRDNDEEVLLKAQHLRSLVSEEESVASLSRHASRVASQVVGNDLYAVQLRAGDDQVLMEFNPSRLPLLTMPAVAVDQPAQEMQLRRWSPAAGTTIHGIAVQARLLDGELISIAIARSLDDVSKTLLRYRRVLVRAVAGGALAALLLSYLLVHKTLQPLRRITRQAGRITMDELDTRIEEPNAPPELRELGASLNGMLARLESGFHLLSQYTENLAHDLRTPVGNLRGQTEVLLSRPRSVADYQALLASNLEEYERLTRMIENILFLARAGNAQIALRKTEFDVGEQLQQVADYFEGLAEESGVGLKVKAAGMLRADAVLFRRALGNLLANALRFTPGGGTIELAAAPAAGGMQVSVSNPGPGIAPEHLDKVFERFYRLDEARSNSADSTGLGLAIVRSIMELHGGKASVESALGGTTRFTLFFPESAMRVGAG